jgi:AraC family transcriptional regulator, activator of mtrCDE
MDALSKVIALTRIEGSLDLRCQMAGGFDIDHEQLQPGEAPFHLVLAGHAQLCLANGRIVQLHAGDFLLLPRGAAHIVRGLGTEQATPAQVDDSGPLTVRRNTDGPVDIDLLCGRFTYDHGAADLIMRALPDVLHVSLMEEGPLDELGSIVSILRNEVRQLRSGALAIVTSLSHVLFVMALRIHAQREGMPASLLALLGDTRLSQAILAMIREPEKAWTVETLAKQANMSRATFGRHFLEKGATSPMDLLTDIRVQLACNHLANSHLPVAEVAERVGYQSESAFAKVFRKRTGTTPHGFRRGQARD